MGKGWLLFWSAGVFWAIIGVGIGANLVKRFIKGDE
jgi:hypothetical protein